MYLDPIDFVMIHTELDNYLDFSKATVSHLENKIDENRCKIVEATTRLFQQFVPRMKEQPDVINSSLYVLNKMGNLVYGDLNEQYKYDEKTAAEDFERLYGFKL